MRPVKILLVALVLLALLALVAARQTSKPMTVQCGVVSGGNTSVVDGVNRAQRAGEWFHDAAKAGEKLTDAKANARHVRAFLWSVWLWWRTFNQSARGVKLDPEIVQLQEANAKARQKLVDSCLVRCPGQPAGPDDAPKSGGDPRANLAGLSGAPLWAAAMRAARFPESEIRMGVTVVRFESSFRPDAILHFRGMRMLGGFQINESAHRDLMSLGDWRDPLVNARMAYRVWFDGGRSWHPWSTASTARRNLLSAASLGHPGNGTNDPAPPSGAAPKQCDDPDPDDEATPGPGRTEDFRQFGNPRSVDEAVDFFAMMARDGTNIRTYACLHYVGLAYGYPGTTPYGGRFWAKDIWYRTPAKWRHPGDRNPPKGALVLWGIRDGHPGHIAISDGSKILTTVDYGYGGRVRRVPFSYFAGYGDYLGWTPPYFPGQTKVGV